jgi:4-alpha-glucanotransferase
MSPATRGRRAGLLVPLFSIPSRRSWGIGEIGDLEPMAQWLTSAGQRVLQVLPITETPPAGPSPYGAISAMAIDPQFITVDDVEDFHAIGGESGLESTWRAELDRVRASSVDYRAVRTLKRLALRRSFEHFATREWGGDSVRARALRSFIEEQSWWLDDYALFRAVHARHGERPWQEWPEALRTRQASALEEERRALAEDIRFRQYLQWIATLQWKEARSRIDGVQLFGDIPFTVGADSADVWARQDEFCLDWAVGTPPDAFNETGQNWGLPAYRWRVSRDRDFDWLRERARRAADLFDGCRVDHVVGFYRTYVRSSEDDTGVFTPEDESEQLAQGERVMQVFLSSGVEIVAEDLGTVPDFVHRSLHRLGVPGYKVLHWQREWDAAGQPVIDPLRYAAASVATTGTHDTAPLAVWWRQAPEGERRAILSIPSVRDRLSEHVRQRALHRPLLEPDLRGALLEAVYAGGADLVILPIQDVFGWTDRINQPGVVSEANWTWRLPWPVDRMSIEPEALAVGRQLRAWVDRHHR